MMLIGPLLSMINHQFDIFELIQNTCPVGLTNRGIECLDKLNGGTQYTISSFQNTDLRIKGLMDKRRTKEVQEKLFV